MSIAEEASVLKGTPYELSYISCPTPHTTKYVFQHTVALNEREARHVIAEAVAKLKSGTAEWSDGRPYVEGEK